MTMETWRDSATGRMVRAARKGEAECPGPDCWMCNGQACALCGAGCWDSSVTDCEHDVIERHTEYVDTGAAR